MSCAEGDTGFVYEGVLPLEVKRTSLKTLGHPRTKAMMNLANPEEAFLLSFIPNEAASHYSHDRHRGVPPPSRSATQLPYVLRWYLEFLLVLQLRQQML